MATLEELEKKVKELEALFIDFKPLPKGLPKQNYSEQKPTAGQVQVWDATRGMYVPQGIASVAGTANTVLYVDSNGVIVELALGADGTVLTSTGASAAPAFEALEAGMKPLVTISPASVISVGTDLGTFGVAAPTSQAIPDAVTIYIPFALSESLTIDRVGWDGTSSGGNTGNIAVGVINEAGVRQFSTGSVSLGADGADVTNTALAAGRYYLAVATDITLGAPSLFSWTITALQGKTMGLAEEVTFPIPATATLATYTRTVIPFVTLSARTFF